MKRSRTLLGMILLGSVMALGVGPAQAAEITGTISSTLTIFEDSELVGNVTCTVVDAACIQFGASDIKLSLNGFTITGSADPPANCVSTDNFLPADGIRVVNQSDVEIEGPGLVQKFRRHGLFLSQSTKVAVKHVTSHHNCFSGIFLGAVSDSDIEENVSVRNGSASSIFPCGGNCITNSHNNRIRRNVFSGNGSVVLNNDFGVGLVGNSSGNLIEENSIGGNVNGVLIQAAANGNVIRRNIIAGNPPIQVSVSFAPFPGVDIQNLSPAGANTFEENHCLTYSGAGPAPCPNILKLDW